MAEIDIQIWQEANEIYGQISDMPVAQALSHIDTIHDLRDEVKAIVITLISSGNQSSQYFKERVSSHLQMPQRTEWKSGQIVAEYELIEEVGRGGMSQVFQAKRVDRDVQKMVALKVFSPREDNEQLLTHFLAEQKILSELSHPNIVTMHHGGTTDEGISYIVMELIDQAAPIDEYVTERKLGEKAIVGLVEKAANAIAYAHANLIIHRDIKPSNLLVDKDGHLKVVDFGIAKLLSGDIHHDNTTIMALTPSYAAPEQINNEKIGVYTDVFALGAVALSLITGQPCLPKDRLLKSCTTDEAYLWSLIRSSSIGSDLKNVLNKALQSAPQDRYQTMHSFAEDLRRWLKNETVSATRGSWWYRLRKFAQRRLAVFASIVTLVITATVGATGLLWQYNKTLLEAEKAREVKNFMLSVFSVTDPDSGVGGSVTARELLAQAGNDLSKRDFTDVEIKSELLQSLGTANLNMGLWQMGEMNLKKSIDLFPDMFESKIQLASLYEKRAEYEKSQSLLQEIVEKKPDYRTSPSWLLIQSRVQTALGKYHASRDTAEGALTGFEKQSDTEGVIAAQVQLAAIDYAESKNDDAIKRLTTTLDLYGDKLSSTNTEILDLKNNLLELYNDFGHFELAIELSEQLLVDVRTVLGNEHPTLPLILLSQAGTYRGVGELDKAQQLAEEAHKLNVKKFGERNANTGRSFNMLGVMAYTRGDITQAIDFMRNALSVYKETLGDTDPTTWEVSTNMAALLNMQKKSTEALNLLQPVFEKQTQKLGSSHKSTLYTASMMVRLLADTGEVAEAIKLGKISVSQSIQEFGYAHPISKGVIFTLSKAYELNNQHEKSLITLLDLEERQLMDHKNESSSDFYSTLSRLYFLNDNYSKAIDYQKLSYDIALSLLGESSVKSSIQLARYVRYLYEDQQMEIAKDHYQKLQKILKKYPEHIKRMDDLLDNLKQYIKE